MGGVIGKNCRAIGTFTGRFVIGEQREIGGEGSICVVVSCCSEDGDEGDPSCRMAQGFPTGCFKIPFEGPEIGEGEPGLHGGFPIKL